MNWPVNPLRGNQTKPLTGEPCAGNPPARFGGGEGPKPIGPSYPYLAGVRETWLAPNVPLESVLPPHASRPHAPCSRLEIGFVFACSIPPLFVLSHSLPRGNTMDKLALFGRFSITASSLPSRLTDHYSLATRFTSHVPRPTIVGGRRRCRAPSWVQHSQPGRRQYATTCYFFGFSVEVWRAWFSTQLNIEIGLTSISL